MALKKEWKNKWEKGDPIGKGGQGLTYFALEKNQPESSGFVIKFLKEQTNLERRKRMYIEIAALKMLSHPNIPDLIDSNETSFEDCTQELFMVTRYIPGKTLQEYIEDEGTMTLNDAISFTLSLANIVKYCHQNGFVHRDIKPDNIILKNNELANPFLIDFGLSFNDEITHQGSETPSWQHLGNRFLSLPELRVVEGNKRDYRSDITMVCGILLFCLTGIHPTDLIDEKLTKPHRREREKNIIEAIAQYRIDSVNNFFDIAFNQAINDRWQSIESVIQNLDNILKMSPNEEEIKDINQKILDFKKKVESRVDYQQLSNIYEILKKCNDVIGNAVSEVIFKLGKDKFGTIQTGYSLDASKQFFTNQIGICSIYESETLFNPKFSCYSNGNELIIDAIESNNRTELARFSFNNDIDWDYLNKKIFEYYVNGITKE